MRRQSNWLGRVPGIGAPWVIAHRGASALAPESSAAAFEAAIAAGADAIETDVRVTKDGHFVCHHDADLTRTSGVAAAIADLTLAELRWASMLPVIELGDVLASVPDRSLLLLDLKVGEEEHTVQLAERLQQHVASGAVAVGVRSLAAQRVISRSAPGLPLLGLLENPDDFPAFQTAGGRWARLWEQDANPSNLTSLQARSLPVVIMVGGQTNESAGRISPERLSLLLTLAPDAIMLNDPRLLREW